MTKVTNEQISIFNALASAYLKEHEGKNKLAYAVKRQLKLIKDKVEQIQDELQEVAINCASVDDKGNLIVNDNNYTYKPEKRIELGKKQREILKREVEIENYFTQEVPEKLDYQFKEAFTGFVIEEKPDF